MDDKQQAMTVTDGDDGIYRAYLAGVAGIHPFRMEDALIPHTAHAMGVISRTRGAITNKAAVIETARRILTEPADEGEAIPAAPRRRPGRPPKVAPAPRKKPSRHSAVRRAAGTKPVACPSHGCEAPGVRAKMNFCAEHAASLSREVRQRLRQLQRKHAADAPAE